MHVVAALPRMAPAAPLAIEPSLPTLRAQPKGDSLHFRDFVLLPRMRMLRHRGMPIEIGGRAFDVLLTLLLQRGEIVSKQEIMRQVWPRVFVDESNLRFQMAMLRKVLGSDRDLIKTVTGRGYLIADEFASSV